MTNEEIKQYFGPDRLVYKFMGNADELFVLQDANSNSYNYIVIDSQIYVSPEKQINDSRAQPLE